MGNGTTVPTGRDVTYSPDEIHRKSFEELFSTAFNKDQRVVLTMLIEGAADNLERLGLSVVNGKLCVTYLV